MQQYTWNIIPVVCTEYDTCCPVVTIQLMQQYTWSIVLILFQREYTFAALQEATKDNALGANLAAGMF